MLSLEQGGSTRRLYAIAPWRCQRKILPFVSRFLRSVRTCRDASRSQVGLEIAIRTRGAHIHPVGDRVEADVLQGVVEEKILPATRLHVSVHHDHVRAAQALMSRRGPRTVGDAQLPEGIAEQHNEVG